VWLPASGDLLFTTPTAAIAADGGLLLPAHGGVLLRLATD
jgi:hypothetical protein